MLLPPTPSASISTAFIVPVCPDDAALIAELRAQLAAKDEATVRLHAELDALRKGLASNTALAAERPTASATAASPTASASASFASFASPLAAAELEISVMMLDSASSMQTSFILSAVASKFRRILQAERCSVYLIDGA